MPDTKSPWGWVRQLALGLLLIAAPVQAAYTVRVYNSGANVVAEGSGTINMAGLSLFGASGFYVGGTQPNAGRMALGAASASQWTGVTGPTSIGPGGATLASSETGAHLAVAGALNSLFVPNGYVSGAALANTARWNNRTLASLGLTVSTYTWTWGAGPTLDTYTLVVGSTQTIAFPNPGNQALGTSPNATATASSGLTVTFSATTPAVCTVAPGGALTLLALGTCTLAVDQAGDAAYFPAPQVQQSFAVVAPPPPPAPSPVPSLGVGALAVLALLAAAMGAWGARRWR